jgi:hypothetical protein
MKRIVAVFLAMGALTAFAPQPQSPPGQDVRLVLLIAVDQFRYDYLTRFRGAYTGGFKKLRTDGAVFTDANLEHYPTVTAVGHSTMLTGATPAVSGIIGNDWFDRETGASVTSVSDQTVTQIGSPTEGGASPRRLLVSTVGDQIKMASPYPKGSAEAPRAIGMSLKDRSSILPLGRGADAAYWWDTKTGNFVSSTYYMKELPSWARAFNDRHLADTHAGEAWMPFSPPGPMIKQMPKERGTALYDAVYASPYGNDILLALAFDVLAHERLGQRGVTDIMSVSFSSNDSVGHTNGPESPQVRDIAIRTDRIIGQLLDRVDKAVGLQHTIVALTADHGVAPVPETLQERGLPGGRMTNKDVFDPIQQALERQYGPGKWLMATAGSSPYLNYELIASLKLDPAVVRQTAATAVMAVPHVARVYTRDQLLRGEVARDRIGERVLRGFNAERSGDLEIILEPFWMRAATGTTHGTPYNYDAHIPLILMGQRIRPGEYSGHVALNDLAPTLSALIEVEPPAGSSGRVLSEALRAAPASPSGTQR